MPLHIPEAPAPALRSVLAALRSPTAVQGAGAQAYVRPPHTALRPELPLPVYELEGMRSPSGSVGAGPSVAGASATSGRSGAAGAYTPPRTRLTGWRFLLRASEAAPDAPAVGWAEAMLTADGWTFSGFREGPYVTATERALQQAEALASAHQPRLLSVPQLYMLTLWLHRDVTADAAECTPEPSDVLIPLAPAPPGIAAHRPHRTDALLPLLTHRLVPAPVLSTPA